MIGFFRRIRKKLADDNQIVKYSRYAVGEIILVVIGILIALSINNWNNNRNNNHKARKVLEAVADNLEQNIQLLNRHLNLIEICDSSRDIILSVLNNKLEENDSLGFYWHRSVINGANLTLSKSGYESLKNIGFDIINNDELQINLLNLYENTYLNLKDRLEWGTNIKPSNDKYLIMNFKRSYGRQQEMFPRNHDFILNDDYFLGLVELAAQQRTFFKGYMQSSLEESRDVLEQIKIDIRD